MQQKDLVRTIDMAYISFYVSQYTSKVYECLKEEDREDSMNKIISQIEQNEPGYYIIFQTESDGDNNVGYLIHHSA